MKFYFSIIFPISFAISTNLLAADSTKRIDREETPLRRARSEPLKSLTEPPENYRNTTPSRRRLSDDEIYARAPEKNDRESRARSRSKTLSVDKSKSPIESMSPSPKVESPKSSLRGNSYKLWPLNCKFMPTPPIFICPEEQANGDLIQEKLQENGVDFILYKISDDIDKLDAKCGNKLLIIFKEHNINGRHVNNIEECEKEITRIDPNTNCKNVLIFGLSNGKPTYELLTQLTIAAYIREAKGKNERFSIKDNSLYFNDILANADETVRLAAILTKRAIKKIVEKGNPFFSVNEEGLLQKFCLKRLIPMMPQESARELSSRFGPF